MAKNIILPDESNLICLAGIKKLAYRIDVPEEKINRAIRECRDYLMSNTNIDVPHGASVEYLLAAIAIEKYLVEHPDIDETSTPLDFDRVANDPEFMAQVRHEVLNAMQRNDPNGMWSEEARERDGADPATNEEVLVTIAEMYNMLPEWDYDNDTFVEPVNEPPPIDQSQMGWGAYRLNRLSQEAWDIATELSELAERADSGEDVTGEMESLAERAEVLEEEDDLLFVSMAFPEPFRSRIRQ